MRRSNRAGFTLVELLIVAVLGAMVVAATYQVLLVNQRTYTAQNAQIQGQQTVRAGLDVLYGELRELSTDGGDILAFGSDTLTVRVMRHFGLVCAADLTLGTLDVLKVGSWFEAGDSVVIFADNNTNTQNDDTWFMGVVAARDTTQACNASKAQRLTIPEVATQALAGTGFVRDGAPVRSYTQYTYGLFTVDGEPFLARRSPSEPTTALVGPLKSSNGLQFVYYDTLGAVATTAANIAQVQVTLRTQSGVRGPDGNLVSDSITTRIYSRN